LCFRLCALFGDRRQKWVDLLTLGAKESFPASIGMRSLGPAEDDLRLQPDDFCQQRLLVVGQGTPQLALVRQFLLQRSDPSHQLAFVEAL
jgi:hypothetical protein